MDPKNEIVRLVIELKGDDYYRIEITKRFTLEYGGGDSTINLGGAFQNMHTAIDAAKRAITVTPADRASWEAENGRWV